MESIDESPLLSRRASLEPAQRPMRLAISIALACVVLHVALALEIDLSPDEAHYALYGAHPDWSYFDHPALVGWLQAPFALASGSNLAMRMVPMVAWVLGLMLMTRLVERLPSLGSGTISPRRWNAVHVVALLTLSPLLFLLGVALVPDTLLIPLVPAAMLATWRLRAPTHLVQLSHWLTLGAILGLCLLAKYTGVFVVLGALLTLHSFYGLALWRYPGPWVMFAVLLVMSSPILAWNAANDWMSIAYQTDHAGGYGEPWRAVPALRAVVLQLLLFGLPTWIGVVHSTRVSLSRQAPTAAQDARRMCWLFGLPVLGTFVLTAGYGASLPHWTTCGWVALLPLAVDGLLRVRRSILVGTTAWQMALLAAIVVLVAHGGFKGEEGAARVSDAGARAAGVKANPLADLYGWPEAARHAAALAAEHQARGIAVMNWSLASRVAWYARPASVFVAPPRRDQFALWFGTLRTGDSAIVIDWSGMPLPIPRGASGFRDCRAIDQVSAIVDGLQVSHFNFLYCNGWSSSPGPGV